MTARSRLLATAFLSAILVASQVASQDRKSAYLWTAGGRANRGTGHALTTARRPGTWMPDPEPEPIGTRPGRLGTPKSLRASPP